MNNSSILKKIVSVLLAFLFGACASGAVGYLIPEGMYLSGLSVFSSPLLAFLYGFSGIVPVVVMSLTMLVTGYLVGSWMIPGYLLLVGIMPGAVMIWGSKKGIKFFSQVRNALIAELVSFVLLLFALKAFTGQDFASYFKSMFDQMLNSLSPEAKNVFLEQLTLLINQETVLENAISSEDMLNLLSEGMEQTLALAMPVTIVLYSVLNGAAGVLWMNWLRHRHKEENVQFVPLRGWRLSKQITLGLIVVLIAVLIIAGKSAEAGISAKFIVITAIISAAFIQASASFLSRLSILGVTAGKRTLFLALMIFVSRTFFPIYGIMSALFGSRGLFIPKVRIVNGNMPPRNEDQNNQEKEDNNKEDQ